jgi:hypothetical protein
MTNRHHIKTNIIPRTSTKPARIKAISDSGLSVTISRSCCSSGRSKDCYPCDSLISNDHKKAAHKLKNKLGWTDKMIGGHTKDGMIFVFHDDDYILRHVNLFDTTRPWIMI